MRDELARALRNKDIVRILRRWDRDVDFSGVPLALSDQLVLTRAIGDGIRFDGYDVLRLDDLRRVERPHPKQDFYRRALALRGEVLGEAPAVDIDDMRTAILSAGRAASLVVVHQEGVDPDVCWIGREPRLVGPDLFAMREIDPGADWYEESQSYRIDKTTRIGFGGAYEDALWLVAQDRETRNSTRRPAPPRRQRMPAVVRAERELGKSNPDYGRVLALLNQGVDLNDPEAAYALASWHLHGQPEAGIGRNLRRAMPLLRRAAKAGLAPALYNLAIAYETGAGVKRNLRLAADTYLRAALAGDDQSAYEVARCLHHGIGFDPDRRAARIWRDLADRLDVDDER